MYKSLLNILICVFLLNYSIRYVMCECCCYLKSEFTSKVDSKSKNFLHKPIGTKNIKTPNINNTTSNVNNNIKIPNIDNFNGTLPVGVNGLSVNPEMKFSSGIVNNADGFKSIFMNSVTDNDFTGESASSKIIKNSDELSLITNKIKANLNLDVSNLKLLYRASVDGDKAAIFHKKCDQAKNTIVLIETDKGKRFGGFTSCSWEGNCEDKPDESAFIFSLDKMKTYDKKLGEDAIGCYPAYGPIFLGCQIRIYDEAFTKGGTTFEKGYNFDTEEDYELTGGDRKFNVKEIEVYEVFPINRC